MFYLRMVLAVLLLVTQNPIPRNGSQQQQYPQTKPTNGQTAQPAIVATKPTNQHGEEAQRYAQYKAKSEQYLKAAFAPTYLSNWVLAGLGVIGGGLAILTLFAIKRQADHMAAQNTQMVSKERARLVVTVADFPEGTLGWYEFKFRVNNLGPTNAYNIQGSSLLSLVPKCSQPAKDFNPIYTPSVIKPEDVEVVLSANSYNIDGNLFADLIANTKTFHIAGIIFYEDVFGEKRETSFHYRLFVGESGWQEMIGEPVTYWVQDGPASDNKAT